MQPPLNNVPNVLHLAAIGLRNRLDVLRPFPTWLVMKADDGHAADVDDLHLALAVCARFVGSVDAAPCNGCRLSLGCRCVCHRDLLARTFDGLLRMTHGPRL